VSNKWILSATEIETFELCRRKWAYQYLDNIKPQPSKAAQFGSAVHTFLQKYLTGNDINYETAEGRVASPGLAYLPQLLPQRFVERQVFFAKDGFIFQGIIDFLESLGNRKWLIGDHKTCSSLTYALSSQELKKNIQANIYAHWAFLEEDAEEVSLKWIYYRTKSTPKAICVESTLTHDEAERNFEPITHAANEIKRIVDSKAKSSSLPKNESACFKYGPCPFLAKCRPNSIRYQVKTTEVFKMSVPAPEIRKSAFHLYVDCAPVKSDAGYEHTIELSELLKPVLQKIKEEKELSHYRLAGYGQHVGLIANYLGEHLKNNPYDNRTAVLSSTKTPEGCDTLQTLSAAAGRVVRGF